MLQSPTILGHHESNYLQNLQDLELANQQFLQLKAELKVKLVQKDCEIALKERSLINLQARLEAELEARQVLLQGHKQSISSLEQKLRSKQSQMLALQQKFSKPRKFQQSNRQLSRKNQELSSEMEQLKQSCLQTLMEKDDEIMRLENRIRELQEEDKGQFRRRVLDLQTEKEEYQQSRNQLIVSLTKDLEEKSEELQLLQERCNRLRVQYQENLNLIQKQYMIEIQNEQIKSAELHTNVENTLKERLEVLSDNFQSSQTRIQDLETQILQKKIAEKANLQKLEEICTEMQNKIQKLSESEQRLLRQNKSLQSQLLTQRSNSQRLQTSKGQQQRRVLQINSQKKKLLELNIQKELRIQNLQEQILDHKARIKELLALCLNKEEEFTAESTAKLLTLKDQFEETKLLSMTDLHQLEAELQELRLKYLAQCKNNQQHRQEISSLKAKIQELQSQQREGDHKFMDYCNKVQIELLRVKLLNEEQKQKMREQLHMQGVAFGKKEKMLNDELSKARLQVDKLRHQGSSKLSLFKKK